MKVKQGSSVVKGPITLLILALEVSNVKATYIKSCPVNLLLLLPEEDFGRGGYTFASGYQMQPAEF